MLGFRMGGAGGGTVSKNLLPPLNSLIRTTPSNTSASTATKRTFTKNTYVLGLGPTNAWDGNVITSFSTTSATTMTINGTTSGYGVGIVLDSKVIQGKTYQLDYVTTGNNMQALFYKADGTFLNRVILDSSSNYSFTVPSTAEYVILQWGLTANTSKTCTLNSLTEIAS